VQGHSEIDILPKNIQNLMEILTLLHCKFNFIILNQTSSSKFFHFVPQGFSWSKPLPVCVFLVPSLDQNAVGTTPLPPKLCERGYARIGFAHMISHQFRVRHSLPLTAKRD
jgi:hypothetical protein